MSIYYNLLFDIKVYIVSILYIIFKLPFYIFYIKGPRFIGCWENKDKQDICSSLTGNSADFWTINIIECEKIIVNKFESYYILFTTIIYIMIIFKIFKVFCWKYFVYKPMLNDIYKILDLNKKLKYKENKL